MASPGKTPTSSRPYSGVNSSSDPTNEPGQYPPGMSYESELFGGPLPTGTGAPGSATGNEALDPTNEKGQTIDGLTGISREEITSTGAPGTQGAVDTDAGADSITYTEASDGILPYKFVTISDNVSGNQDWTGANDQGYASGGPQLPGLKGNEPQAGQGRFQPGAGHVMRGGRDVRP